LLTEVLGSVIHNDIPSFHQHSKRFVCYVALR